MLMLKTHFEEFKEKYNALSMKKGAYNIWLQHKSNNYGYKFFFQKWKGPQRFLKEYEVNKKGIEEPYIKPNDSLQNRDLLDINNINIMFNLLNTLYLNYLHPKPLEIIYFKTCCAIKIEAATPISIEQWKTIPKLETYQVLDTILPKSQANYILNHYKNHNYGEYNNNLVIIDIDSAILNHYKRENDL